MEFIPQGKKFTMTAVGYTASGIGNIFPSERHIPYIIKGNKSSLKITIITVFVFGSTSRTENVERTSPMNNKDAGPVHTDKSDNTADANSGTGS